RTLTTAGNMDSCRWGISSASPNMFTFPAIRGRDLGRSVNCAQNSDFSVAFGLHLTLHPVARGGIHKSPASQSHAGNLCDHGVARRPFRAAVELRTDWKSRPAACEFTRRTPCAAVSP